jgi:hypothetical protein
MATGDPNDPTQNAAQQTSSVADAQATAAHQSHAADEVTRQFEAMKGVAAAAKELVEYLRSSTSLYGETMTKLALITETYQKLRVGGEIHNQQMRIDNEMRKHRLEMEKEELKLGSDIFAQIKQRRMETEQEIASIGGGDRARMVARKTADVIAVELTNVGGIIPKVLSNIPFGGIAMLLLHGVGADAQWNANVNKVINQFQRMGGGGQEFAGMLKGQIKEMELWNEHATADLVAVTQQFAEAGISAKQAWGKQGFAGALSEVGPNLAHVTLQFDYLNKQQAGWTASMVKVATRDMGNSIREASEAIVQYGMAAQHAGQDTVTFLSRVMQNAEAMKLYGIRLSDVAEQQLRLIGINAKRVGGDMAYAGTISAAGQAGMLQALPKMDMGLAAIMGKELIANLDKLDPGTRARLDKAGGYGTDPVGIAMEMQVLMRDLKGTKAGDASLPTLLKVISEFADRLAPRGGRQDFLLQQLFGMPSLDAARAVTDIGRSATTGGKLSDEDAKRLKKAFTLPESETSKLTIALNTAVQGMKDLANGVLGMMLMGIMTIATGIGVLVKKAQNPLSDVSREVEMFKGAMGGFGEFASLSGGGLMKVIAGLGLAADSIPALHKAVEIIKTAYGSKHIDAAVKEEADKAKAKTTADASKAKAPKGIDKNKWQSAVTQFGSLMKISNDTDKAIENVKRLTFKGDEAGGAAFEKALKAAIAKDGGKTDLKGKAFKATVQRDGNIVIEQRLVVTPGPQPIENAAGQNH